MAPSAVPSSSGRRFGEKCLRGGQTIGRQQALPQSIGAGLEAHSGQHYKLRHEGEGCARRLARRVRGRLARRRRSQPPRRVAATLPQRVTRVVLHTPGGPDYGKPERRFRFLSPRQTQALWSSRFGAQWILWTDGSLWPRHPRDAGQPVLASRRVAGRERRGPATHSGRGGSGLRPRRRLQRRQRRHRGRPFRPQRRAVPGRAGARAGVAAAHHVRDVRAAVWVRNAGRWATRISMRAPRTWTTAATTNPCPYYVDESGEAYRRRVDPPESLFVALAAAASTCRDPRARPPTVTCCAPRRCRAAPCRGSHQ